MIDPKTLRNTDIGRAVVYTPRVGRREDGVISSWNDSYVFVRYGGDRTAKATEPGDLDWPAPRREPCTDPDKMHGAGDGFGGGDY